MKRREFLRSLGGAVAAAMLPFTRPLEQPKWEPRWQSNVNGIRAALADCSRYIEPAKPSLDLQNLFTEMYAMKRDRTAAIEIITDDDGKKFIERLAGVA